LLQLHPLQRIPQQLVTVQTERVQIGPDRANKKRRLLLFKSKLIFK
jgi:hypothetical protein